MAGIARDVSLFRTFATMVVEGYVTGRDKLDLRKRVMRVRMVIISSSEAYALANATFDAQGREAGSWYASRARVVDD